MDSITINDVAKLAGVSKATVSNVMNRKGNVSEKTIRRVLDACKNLDYYPSFAASSLATRRTGIFGLFIYEREDPFEDGVCLNLMEGLILESAKVDMQLLVYYGTTEMKMQHIINGKGPLDGAVILRPVRNDFRIKALSQNAIKTVIVGTPVGNDNSQALYVDVNNIQMTQEIINRLIRFGAKQFLFINSRADYSVSQERNIGFYNALTENGISTEDSLVINLSSINGSVVEIARSFLDRHPENTAIINTFANTSENIFGSVRFHDRKVMIFDFERVFVNYKNLGEKAFRLLYDSLNEKELEQIPKHQIAPYTIDYSQLAFQ